jgi:hypothetical protein
MANGARAPYMSAKAQALSQQSGRVASTKSLGGK